MTDRTKIGTFQIVTKLELLFFSSEMGNEPVREWLLSLSKEDKKRIGEDIKTVQFGWPLGMPLVDSLGKGLWEIRIKLHSSRIARIIFFITHSTIILVHGFIKKTQKTPQQELELALERKQLHEKNRSVI